jgi:hypothetical protein
MSSNVVEQQTAYQRRKAHQLCVRCGDPLGPGDTTVLHRACADKQIEYQQAVVAAGNCASCHRPRGNDGTARHCRPCATNANATSSKTHARRRDEGKCKNCGKPRGEDGTADRCRRCADKNQETNRRWHDDLFDEGRCYRHGDMNLLDDCPACLYEAKTITARDFTFVGLTRPPASGDKLGVCVGCRKCRRSYCKTQSYYHPILPRDLKLRDEHVGEEGCGLWLRFGQSDGKGPVQIEYESCSLPEDTCKKPVSMKLALNYLRQDRVGHSTPKVCKTHADDFARRTAATVARVRGNGNEQKNVAHRQREDRDQWLLGIIAKIAERWRKLPETNDEAERKDNLTRIKQEYVANDLGLTVTGLRGRLDTCGWKEMFPNATKRFPELVAFIARGLDRGDSEEKILNGLRALSVASIQKSL